MSLLTFCQFPARQCRDIDVVGRISDVEYTSSRCTAAISRVDLNALIYRREHISLDR